MYEQYTNEQIVEMLIPKLNKATGHDWNDLFEYPKVCADMIKAISLAYRSGYVRGQLGRSFIIGEKKVKEPVNTFKVGDKVKFLGISIEDVEAWNNRWFYPPVNTICKVIKSGPINCLVHWPKGITAGDGVWACPNKYLEKVTEHWVPATKDNVKIGSKVRMADGESHRRYPRRYPDVGTVGIVMKAGLHIHSIQWPEGSTSENDVWHCEDIKLEVLVCE